jgi:glutamate synthase domain-containing protein 1
MRLLLIGFVLLSLTAGCTHAVHNYHVSDSRVNFAQSKNIQKISSQAEQLVILGFVGQTDYVNQAFQSLQNSCSQGRITQIHTRYSTSHGFLSWTNKIKMQAYCVN